MTNEQIKEDINEFSKMLEVLKKEIVFWAEGNYLMSKEANQEQLRINTWCLDILIKHIEHLKITLNKNKGA